MKRTLAKRLGVWNPWTKEMPRPPRDELYDFLGKTPVNNWTVTAASVDEILDLLGGPSKRIDPSAPPQPDANGWYYHRAPTEERERIRQHGVQPSSPRLNPVWNPNAVANQPEGVYVTGNPQGANSIFDSPTDVWRIPADSVRSINRDPEMGWGNGYIPHAVDAELHEPFERSDRFVNPATNNRPGDTYPWEYDLADDMDAYDDQHKEGNPWRIGLPSQASTIQTQIRSKGFEQTADGPRTDLWTISAVSPDEDALLSRTWEKMGAMEWTPGSWGKGFQDEAGNLHTWNTSRHPGSPWGGYPHHYEVAESQGANEWMNPVVISPEGWYTTNGNPYQIDEDAGRFAEAHPALKYMRNEDRWFNRVSAKQAGVYDYYYHVAPRSQRDRIQQHGLYPSVPSQANYPADRLDSPSQRMEDQPAGVYVTKSPRGSDNWRGTPTEWGTTEWGPMRRDTDLWRIPRADVQDIRPDAIERNAWYITHPVPHPELYQPGTNEEERLWEDHELAEGKPSEPISGWGWQITPEMGIGMPNRVWGKTADNFTNDSREWPDPTEPRASKPPAQQGCTCQWGDKLNCPIHGLNADPENAELDHSWSLPENSPVGYPQDQPRSWTGPYQSSWLPRCSW